MSQFCSNFSIDSFMGVEVSFACQSLVRKSFHTLPKIDCLLQSILVSLFLLSDSPLQFFWKFSLSSLPNLWPPFILLNSTKILTSTETDITNSSNLSLKTDSGISPKKCCFVDHIVPKHYDLTQILQIIFPNGHIQIVISCFILRDS